MPVRAYLYDATGTDHMPNNRDDSEIERLREEVLYLRGLRIEQERTEYILSMTERRVAEQSLVLANTQGRLEHQLRLFDTVLSSIVDFAYTFDREGRFTYINQALLDLWQMKLEDALGKNFFELNYPKELAARLQQQIETVFTTRQRLKDETPYTGAAGTTGYYEYIFVPVFDTYGQVEAVAGSTRDISERYAMEADLRDTKTRLESTLSAGDIATWIWNIQTDSVIADKNLSRLFAVSPEVAAGGPIAEYIRALHPDDRTRVKETLQAAIDSGEDYEAAYRLVDREGSERWVIARRRVEYDERGTPLRMPGIVLDITEQRRAQREIEALNQRLKRSMQETHHRVKNNLQVISAMIEMQVMEYEEEKTVPLSEFVRLKAHVHTLAIVHDLLTLSIKEEADAQRISTKTVLERLLPMLQSTAWKKVVHYAIHEVILTSKQCIALSLILNELVSNALKHGKKDADVSFTVQGTEAILRVCDDGAGFPDGFDPKQAANTGLELVGSLVHTDLQGRITYGNQPEGGGLVTVVFPLPPDEE